MPYPKQERSVCSSHGPPTHRALYKKCNRICMRTHLREARHKSPARALWMRAWDRTDRRGLKFKLHPDTIPKRSPLLGISLIIGASRSKNSASLDGVDPDGGYSVGYLRVLGHQASRLKSNLNNAQLRKRSIEERQPERCEECQKRAACADRKALLNEVRHKAAEGGRAGEEWVKIAVWLERRFAAGEVDSNPSSR